MYSVHFPCVIGVSAVVLTRAEKIPISMTKRWIKLNNFMVDERQINRDTD